MTQAAFERLDAWIAAEAARIAARFARCDPAGAPAGLAGALLAHDPPCLLPALSPQMLDPPWRTLIARLGLSPVELLVMFAAAAPDLDPRYASLFALLHDDATLPWFSADLAMRLGGAPARDACAPQGRLQRERLLQGLGSRAGAVCRDRAGLRVHPHLLTFLREERAAIALAPLPERQTSDALADLDILMALPAERPLVLLVGCDRRAQRRAAGELLARLGRGLLIAPMPAPTPEGPGEALGDLVLQARLQQAGLLLEAAPDAAHRAVAGLAHGHVPVFISAGDEAEWRAALGPDVALVSVADEALSLARRRQAWGEALALEGLAAGADDIDRVALRHRLNETEIARAAQALRLDALRRHAPLTIAGEDLLAVAAGTRRADFGPLATRLDGLADWDSLVLPACTHEALGDFAAAMGHGARIFEDWGFGGIGRGRRGGVSALFTGPSGTGKTMAAGIVAREAGYEAWRIDLSGLVSKYIGETEKNLERVFNAARAADVVLFFDEADAIFGTRSEVKDAHDRYANIETAYLLQRLEDHDGPVILASNIAANIDQAFLRRIDFVIEFPMPDAGLRAEIWRRSLPRAAPLADDIDIAFLARQFVLAGGDIRAVTLDAAFRAARRGAVIDMALLLRAVARQMAKHGRVPALAEFGRYRALLEEPPIREAAE
jgi:hypothetical protein